MFSNLIQDNVNNSILFEVEGVHISILNGLRRILTSDIPIVGFLGNSDENTIEITDNTTVLTNEQIKERISMIPIHIEDTYNENFVSGENSIEIELDIKSNKDDILKHITTDDLTVKFDGKDIKPNKLFQYHNISNRPIMITKIRKQETLHLKASAVKETPRTNASFCIISGITLHPKFNPNTDETDILAQQRDIVKNVHVFGFEIINNTITPNYLINKAIDIFIQKNNNVMLDLQSYDSKIKFEKYSDNVENCYEFNILNENDTIGYAIQSYIYMNYVQTKKKINTNNNICVFAGYVKKHPLQDVLTIRITIDGTDDINVYKTFIASVCNEIVTNVLSPLKEKFNSFITKANSKKK